ncbi:MAG: cysteine protease StiP domain-containing protein [Methylovulum miyakonense]|uniref:cysteine protease StiP domain-containing protein n=1 Tax=Methylovulum miyakonense TaxID=645578 RepID=UPI003BB65450
MAQIPFSGSYSTNDVEFLLKQITIENTPIAVKEALIQSGQKHYSQMLSHESLPSAAYLDLFRQAMATNRQRVAADIISLAEGIIATRPHGVALVSLARAGTPVGVLLKRVLQSHHQINAAHYSISIIRDVGIDTHALRHILQRHAPETLVFVDGWTGKGVIGRQLAASLQRFAETDNVTIPAELYVLADLSGTAAVAASAEDYLIPSCILNATVSGLVSRSVYDAQTAAAGFHGCVYYQDFAEHDLSGYFIAEILASVAEQWNHPQRDIRPAQYQVGQAAVAEKLLDDLATRYNVSHPNYIKPGIGEATRVFLRREARLLLLQDDAAEATLHLRWLAESRAIPIVVCPDLPYRAVALIKEITT